MACTKTQEKLQALPAVGLLLQQPEVSKLCDQNSRRTVKQAVRNVIKQARITKTFPQKFQDWAEPIKSEVSRLTQPSLKKVLNATGVILHTNLGRAPLNRDLLFELNDLMSGYVNLEFDLEKGERGSRYTHCSEALCLATGAEDALVVNNNAAAVMLMLRAMAKDHQVIISRGELVEIGGSFRIPEIMEASGATLKEVGTTNRTRLEDYEQAISSQTSVLLKVHPSNYQIQGFVESVSLADLVKLGAKHDLPVAMDLGSGALEALPNVNPTEYLVPSLLKTGVSVITFSGDKLLGGPQSGIILGETKWLSKIRHDPWLRMVRVDKVTLALLERLIRGPGSIHSKSVTAYFFSRSTDDLKSQANRFLTLIEPVSDPWKIMMKDTQCTAGGGSLPQANMSSIGISIQADPERLDLLEMALRSGEVPVMGRRKKFEIILDLRTIFPEDVPLLTKMCNVAIQRVDKEF